MTCEHCCPEHCPTPELVFVTYKGNRYVFDGPGCATRMGDHCPHGEFAATIRAGTCTPTGESLCVDMRELEEYP